MKTETLLSIVQTVALCLIAVLLLALVVSPKPAASVDPYIELAALIQIQSQMNSEEAIALQNLDISKADLKKANAAKEDDSDEKRSVDLWTNTRKRVIAQNDTVSKLITQKRKALFPE